MSKEDIRYIWELIVRERRGMNARDFYYDCVHNLKQCHGSDSKAHQYLRESANYAYSECLVKRSRSPLDTSGLFTLLQDVNHFDFARVVFKYITGVELDLEFLETIIERRPRNINWEDLLHEISLCYNTDTESQLDEIIEHLSKILSKYQEKLAQEIDHFDHTLLVKSFTEHWKKPTKHFCYDYDIDYSNFCAWLKGKRNSPASEEAVKLFLKDVLTTPAIQSSKEEIQEHIKPTQMNNLQK